MFVKQAREAGGLNGELAACWLQKRRFATLTVRKVKYKLQLSENLESD